METIRKGHIDIHFSSIIDFIDAPPPRNEYNNKKYHGLKTRRYSEGHYYGKAGPTIKSYQDAVDKALLGDHELYEKYLIPKVEELNKALHVETSSYAHIVPVVKRRRVKSSFGDELDIHAVNQGRLDKAWSTTERIEFDQEHHLVTILADIGNNWNISADDTLWMAASMVKLISDIELSGKSVQIIIGGTGAGITRNGANGTYTIVVKKYNESLSLERLAAMCHVGFFRSVMFDAIHRCSDTVCETLGHSVHFNKGNYPFVLQDEIELGHTKVILMDKALNLHQAIRSLNSAYKQMTDK